MMSIGPWGMKHLIISESKLIHHSEHASVPSSHQELNHQIMRQPQEREAVSRRLDHQRALYSVLLTHEILLRRFMHGGTNVLSVTGSIPHLK